MWWILIALLGGCDDTTFNSPEPEIPEGEGYSAVVQIFNDNCLGACHGAGASFPDLETDPCGTLVDQDSQGYSGKLVVPGDSEASVLWNKMNNTGEFGGIMPAGAPETLPEDLLQLVTDWIDEGATCEEGDQDTGPDPDTGTGDDILFGDLYPALQTQCVGCHGEAAPSAGLALEPESAAFATLTSGSGSDGRVFVDTTNPTDSYLYLKVTSEASIVGDPMPPTVGLDPSESADVLAWIEQGARE